MTSDDRAQIEAAIDRLLAGTPLRSDGKLTVVSLAAEAGVKRYLLTHRHTDLKDRFYARIKAQNAIPAKETTLGEQNARLQARLDDLRGERDEYKRAANARARNVLAAENDALCRQASRCERSSPAPLAPVG